MSLQRFTSNSKKRTKYEKLQTTQSFQSNKYVLKEDI